MAQGFAAELVGVLDGTLNPRQSATGASPMRAAHPSRNARPRAGDDQERQRRHQRACAHSARAASSSAILNFDGRRSARRRPSRSATRTTAAKYKNAAVFTHARHADLYMNAAAQDDAPLADFEDVLMTFGAANLPGAGIVVVELLVSGR
jgi:hypothetical protein